MDFLGASQKIEYFPIPKINRMPPVQQNSNQIQTPTIPNLGNLLNPRPVYLFPATNNKPTAQPISKYNPPKATVNFPPTSTVNVYRPKSVPFTGSAYSPGNKTNNSKSWPLAKFYFDVSVDWVGTMGFQSCEGLEATVEAYEFRDGNSTNYFKEKRPGLTTFGNITLKKGTFQKDDALYRWFKNVSSGAFFGDLRTVKIKLKDEQGSDIFTWTVNRAFVVKFTPTSMDANDGDEVAIEEVELACQSWTMDSGDGLFSFVTSAVSTASAAASMLSSTANSLTFGATASINL
jgi:phage tail-like protein